MTPEQAPFGVLLQRHRLAAGLSQNELAESAGLSRRGISDLERGVRRSPYPATVRRLAAALSLSPLEQSAFLKALGRADSAPREISSAALPRALTSFIGREREVAEVGAVLQSTRLLTLIGPGGIGKTRLALEVAGSLAFESAFVDLVTLERAAILPE